MKHLVRFFDDGSCVIAIVSDGLPLEEATIPAPFMPEIDRFEMVRQRINSIYLRGFFVEDVQKVKNSVFDREGRKTSTKVLFRPCKSRDEANFVLERIKEIAERYVEGDDPACRQI